MKFPCGFWFLKFFSSRNYPTFDYKMPNILHFFFPLSKNNNKNFIIMKGQYEESQRLICKKKNFQPIFLRFHEDTQFLT